MESKAAGQRLGLALVTQDAVGGCALLAIAALAFYLSFDLTNGTLTAVGPGLLPHFLAALLAVSGAVLLLRGLRSKGERLSRVEWRGPLLVLAAILLFSVTIRPTEIGPLTLPGLGLVVSGPITIILSGMASPRARLLDLLILSLFLTAFCIALFGDILALSLPILPQALLAALIDTWPLQTLLRITVAFLVVSGGLLYFLRRRLRPHNSTDNTEIQEEAP